MLILSSKALLRFKDLEKQWYLESVSAKKTKQQGI
jgi:hypothetical protein